MGGVFALTLAFVFSPSLFGRLLGFDLVPVAVIGLIVLLGTSFALMALAVTRLNAWKRANPWTPPS
jgi:multisubunit Na+/H+ antiporter MnhF subunit